MISKWYRGHEGKQSPLDNFGVIWLTDDVDYAQEYADGAPEGIVSIVYVDDDKLNPVDVFHNDFDTYFPASKDIKELKEEGFNCYYFCAGDDDVQCLALLSNEPVVKTEKYNVTKLTENDLKYIIKETINELSNNSESYKEFVNKILADINEYLTDFGLSCSINSKYDFSGYYKDCVAIYQYRSVMNNGKMRIALNIPLMLSHDLDDYEMKEQIEISMWHEVGHGIVQWIKSLRRKDTQAKTGLFKGKIVKDLRYILNNEEDVVEEFGAYQTGYYTYSTLNDFINDYSEILNPNKSLEEGKIGKALGTLALGGALLFGGGNQMHAQTNDNPQLNKQIIKTEKQLVKFGYADNVDEIGIIVKSAKTSNLAKLIANEEFRNTILSKDPNAQIIKTDFTENPDNGEYMVIIYYVSKIIKA